MVEMVSRGSFTRHGGADQRFGFERSVERCPPTACQRVVIALCAVILTVRFTPAAGQTINEIHVDPAPGPEGDANGDGVRHAIEDEFVEIVNDTGADLDLRGWTLSDGLTVRHRFVEGTVVPADCAVVIFGGGRPTGAFGNSLVRVAGALGLNNVGDTVTLADDHGTIAAQVVYDTEGGIDQSLTRDPDVSGSFVRHAIATGSHGARFSPGVRVDGTMFAGCVRTGDCTGDGVLDLFDFADFEPCVSGPGGGTVNPGCACFDLDGDRAVRLRDWGLLQLYYSP